MDPADPLSPPALLEAKASGAECRVLLDHPPRRPAAGRLTLSGMRIMMMRMMMTARRVAQIRAGVQRARKNLGLQVVLGDIKTPLEQRAYDITFDRALERARLRSLH